MKNTFIALLFFLLLQLLLSNAASASYNSLDDFEAYNNEYGGTGAGKSDSHNCFTGPDGENKAISPISYNVFNNTYIPPIISPNAVMPETENYSGVLAGTHLAVAATAGIGWLIQYAIMVDICSNTYIVQPHEYVNRERGSPYYVCDRGDGSAGTGVNTGAAKFLSPAIPYFYSCDPTYDPVSGQNVTSAAFQSDAVATGAYGISSGQGNSLVGKVWGYYGPAECSNLITQQNARPSMIGKIVIEYMNGGSRFFIGYYKCSTDRTQVIMKAGDYEWIGGAKVLAYYNIETSGKLRLCAAAITTVPPVLIGCSSVAPPAEEENVDIEAVNYVSGTRCSYFLGGRTDLQSLGAALAKNNPGNPSPVPSFLQSDLHMTSTVVGCIRDLILKVMITSDDPQKPSFFISLQTRLRQIVVAVLTLYLTLLGIKIMSAAQLPSRGEWIMYAIKFGLVVYFVTPDPWYQMQANGEVKGLFPTLLWAADEIANFFLNAQNVNDVVGLCRYQYQGAELLGARNIPVWDEVQATSGHNVVAMTVWDLVDCKVVNYLNMGSCQYTFSGLIGFWMPGLAFINPIFAIVCFVFSLMILLIIFKFTHIFILSSFIIAILVLLSPIFIAFALFEATKGMFDMWFKYLLGYVLYPAMLMAFVALMLATFDAVFLGDLVSKGNGPASINISDGAALKAACKDVTNSLFCKTVNNLQKDTVISPCNSSPGSINSIYTKTLDLGAGFSVTTIKDEIADDYYDAVLRLMLFALLFYLFIGSVTQFLAAMVSVQDLGGYAQGSINIGTKTASIGSSAAGALGGGIGKGMGKLSGGSKK